MVIVRRFGLDAAAVHAEIERCTTRKRKTSTSVDLPLSNESKRVLAFAAEEAERLTNKHIGSEHLFLGLLRESSGLAADILLDFGLKVDFVRPEIASLQGDPGKSQAAPPRLNLWNVEVIEDNQPLPVTAILLPVPPRPGDELTLELEDGPHNYKVQRVRFVLARDPDTSTPRQALEILQIFVTKAD